MTSDQKASDEFRFCVIYVIHFDVFFHCRFSLSLTKLFLDLTDAWRNPTNALTKDVCKNDVMFQWKEYFFCFSSSFMRMKLHILLFRNALTFLMELVLVMWKTSNHAFNFAWILKSIPLTKQVYFIVFKVFQEVWQKIHHNRDDFSNKLLSLWEKGKKGQT